jgi:hypothetical protein
MIARAVVVGEWVGRNEGFGHATPLKEVLLVSKRLGGGLFFTSSSSIVHLQVVTITPYFLIVVTPGGRKRPYHPRVGKPVRPADPPRKFCAVNINAQHHSTYTSWFNREADSDRVIPELLWLKGKPGSGKSTLMKSLMNSNPRLDSPDSNNCMAFFFDRKGSSKQKSSNGLYRSLLYQLVEADPAVCTFMLSKYEEKVRDLEPMEGASTQRLHWSTAELESILQDLFRMDSMRPTIILIDSVDECGEENEAKDVVKFCRDLLRHARENGAILNICIFSGSNFIFGEGGHLLTLYQHNAADISTYVQDRIESHGMSARPLTNLVGDVVTKSAGIFL